ncbi:unnamed protein product [Linum trigynum]|uniref:Uncharacterized protein n=1 Tax=Linum trigynum TaxID=586398 RepID=A0AAV2CZ95_9ROSI
METITPKLSGRCGGRRGPHDVQRFTESRQRHLSILAGESSSPHVAFPPISDAEPPSIKISGGHHRPEQQNKQHPSRLRWRLGRKKKKKRGQAEVSDWRWHSM